MVTHLPYELQLICETDKGLLMGYWTLWPFNYLNHQHYYLELLEDTNIDTLQMICADELRI